MSDVDRNPQPTATYDEVQARAIAEVQKLEALRHPNITYIFDAFEFRDTFYIITERCHLSGHDLFSIPGFDGRLWIEPMAGSL
ncbi:MAG TPA: hypothetical protein VJA45_12485, partial [Methylomirabilota bacterium]|nr:hypothetical protein [Methylomirabilota bacterium]